MKKLALFTLLVCLMPWLSRCKKSGSDEPKKAIVSTFAGGLEGFLDGPADTARFEDPVDIAVLSDGTLYVTDAKNVRVRKISPAGIVSTLAGDGNPGTENGPGPAARFRQLTMIAADAAGNAYVLDAVNYQIRKMTPSGMVSVYAGKEAFGFEDGPVATAKFGLMPGILVDPQGNVIVADASNHRIRKISTAGQVSTIAGSGIAGYSDGMATAAQFNSPYGIAMDKQGNIYVADAGNYRIRKITPGGAVSTLAGSGIKGVADGNGSIAQFDALWDIIADSRGNLYVTNGSCIRKITPAGEVSTFAGSSSIEGDTDGDAATATFGHLAGLAIDAADNIYVPDITNDRIRKISFQ